MNWEFIVSFCISIVGSFMVGYKWGHPPNRQQPPEAEKEPTTHTTPSTSPYGSWGFLPHEKVECCRVLDLKVEEDRQRKQAEQEKADKENIEAGKAKFALLPACSEVPKCSRCGSTAVVTASYRGDMYGMYSWVERPAYGGHTVLRRTCMICDNQWDEKPLDADKEKV